MNGRLSEAFNAVRMTGATFFHAECAAPLPPRRNLSGAAQRIGSQEIVDSARLARPAWTKLITTFPPERYDILAFGLRLPPRASEAGQNYYD